MQIGRELVEKEFKRYGESLSKYIKNNAITEAFKESKYRTIEEILVAIGYGKIGPQMVVKRVLPQELRERKALTRNRPTPGRE